MMKSILTLTLALAYSYLFAQNPILQFGANLSNMYEVDDTKKYSGSNNMGLGLNIGLLYEHSIQDNFALQSGFFINKKSSRDNAFLEVYATNIKARLNLNYMEIPLYIKYHPLKDNPEFFVKGGGYLGLGLWGRIKIQAQSGNDYLKTSFDVEWGSKESELKRLDYGLSGGFGLVVNQMIFTIMYQHGLQDIANIDKDNHLFQNRVLSYNIAYRY